MSATRSKKPILFSGPMVRAILEGRKTQTRRAIRLKWKVKKPSKYEPNPTSEVCALSGGCSAERWPNGTMWTWDSRGIGGENWNEQDLGPGEKPDMLPLIAHRQGFLLPSHPIGSDMWVKETCSVISVYAWHQDGLTESAYRIEYRAGGHRHIEYSGSFGGDKEYVQAYDRQRGVWRPAIFMPRWASRITLKVMDVRVQRLRDISAEDAKAEGLKCLSKDGGRTWKWGIPDSDGEPGNDDHGWYWQDWRTDPVAAYRHLWESINGPGSWDANPWVWVYTFNQENARHAHV